MKRMFGFIGIIVGTQFIMSLPAIAKAPATPTLVQPIGGVWQDSLPVHFEWTAVTKSALPIEYVIQIDTTASFTTPVLTDTTTDTDYDTTLFEDYFYWKIMADSAGNPGDWTKIDSFGVDTTAPSVPILISPLDSAYLNNSTVAFEWSPATDNLSGVSGYHLQVDTTPNFANSIHDTICYEPRIEVGDFDDTADYLYWRARTIDCATNISVWSVVRHFWIDLTPPVIDSTTVLPDTNAFWGPFPIETKVTDNCPLISNPVLFYRTSVDTNWVADTMNSLGGDWYIDSIPVQTPVVDSIIVDYYLTAEDSAGNNSRDPVSGLYSFILRNLASAEEDRKVPDKFILFSPTPNPSQRNAVIKYGVPEKANMTLSLYNISGRLVKTLYSGTQEKGYYEVDIKQDELKGGIYFIRFEVPKNRDFAGSTGNFKATRKLTILR